MIPNQIFGKKSPVMGAVLFGLVVLFILFSGCTHAAIKGGESALKDAGMTAAAHAGSDTAGQLIQESADKRATGISIIDETKRIERETMVYYLLAGDKGYQFNIDVVTDGAPVDIFIMDEQSYQVYSKAFEQGSDFSINAISFKNVARKSVKYSLPSQGSYYLVIENAYFIKDGADAERAVNVNVVVTLIR